MANSADPDQLASSDLHCLQRQGISGFSRTRVNSQFPYCDKKLTCMFFCTDQLIILFMPRGLFYLNSLGRSISHIRGI